MVVFLNSFGYNSRCLSFVKTHSNARKPGMHGEQLGCIGEQEPKVPTSLAKQTTSYVIQKGLPCKMVSKLIYLDLMNQGNMLN